MRESPTKFFEVMSSPTVKFENGWSGRELRMHPLERTYVGKDIWVVNLFVRSNEELIIRRRNEPQHGP